MCQPSKCFTLTLNFISLLFGSPHILDVFPHSSVTQSNGRLTLRRTFPFPFIRLGTYLVYSIGKRWEHWNLGWGNWSSSWRKKKEETMNVAHTPYVSTAIQREASAAAKRRSIPCGQLNLLYSPNCFWRSFWIWKICFEKEKVSNRRIYSW